MILIAKPCKPVFAEGVVRIGTTHELREIKFVLIELKRTKRRRNQTCIPTLTLNKS